MSHLQRPTGLGFMSEFDYGDYGTGGGYDYYDDSGYYYGGGSGGGDYWDYGGYGDLGYGDITPGVDSSGDMGGYYDPDSGDYYYYGDDGSITTDYADGSTDYTDPNGNYEY